MTEPPGARLRVALTGADRRRIFPRCRRRGHAAVHRQHFPLHAGRFGSFRAARPHAQRRRLPAEPGHGNGRIAGAHHVHQEGIGHLGAGHLRARRRSDRSRAGDHFCSPGCDHGAFARADGNRNLSRGRSAGFDLAHSRSAHRRPGALRRGAGREEDPADLQRPAGHHRHSRHRRTERRPEAHRGPRPQNPEDSSRSPSTWPSSSPARRAAT